ncbi:MULTISPECIES: hypothetical protein [Mycolicibacterium]|uniref:Uncharacterized protein n=1 Tax=Mycolicibacterium senegalense TaxID=1796 RepID=A0A378T3N1_9MYCO|nr:MULTISPECIES: hypothetical protein [Mycolicibacterium]MCV7338101.1 hypothetical protein [Mycolicibacterium senegalense]MDR7290174.1 hypothetical protein [Mycolicibacterium senegalense]QZA26920.1 hypothetical protein K3U95_13330 [Mycolicibacterium senegalense]CDP82124.1 hypothetical protein BN975_00238 [Mycolicibacterium farcinogenes]STZ54473.1 Uncharacterised protein [Mycolicibacterium senegalense]
MGILFGFAPWIIYWVLVGNVPFLVAVLVALATAVATFTISRISGAPGRTLEVGALATFVVLTILTLVLSQDVMERWIQPLSTAGIFLVALIGQLIGKPFVMEFAAAGQPPGVVESDLFQRIVKILTWIWVGVFAGMTVSSAIPPIVQGDATILDTETPLSFICYWVIPFVLLGLAALASRVLPDRMTAGMNDIVRKTTFVAFSEAEIDQLYYLAQEHANREVGAGQEAYDVRVGGSGTPLVGDESRMSWPSTYKVRDRKR